MQYSTVQYSTVQYSTVQYSTVQIVSHWTLDGTTTEPSLSASSYEEKFPSRVFEAAVNHRDMFLSATRGFCGSVSDKSIVKFDGTMMAMKNGMYDE